LSRIIGWHAFSPNDLMRRRSYRKKREKARVLQTGQKNQARDVITEPDLSTCADRSVAEEQPQQNDHWDRYAQQPKQNSSSHHNLHEFFIDSTTREARRGSCSRSRKTHRPCRNPAKMEGVRLCYESGAIPIMPRYKLAIFDLDGTLSDSFPWFLRVVNSVADKHRFRRIEADDVDMLRGKSSREIIGHLEVPMWRIPVIVADMRRLKSQSIDAIPLFTGVAPMLQELSQRGVVLAVVSSDSVSNARRALGQQAAPISHFACGASLFGKAAKFKAVLKRTGIAAADAICIGDEVRDGEAARQAGIDFGAVCWGYAKPEALRQVSPVLVFDSVADIARLI
jgi:phosphoglycolate phosphatase